MTLKGKVKFPELKLSSSLMGVKGEVEKYNLPSCHHDSPSRSISEDKPHQQSSVTRLSH